MLLAFLFFSLDARAKESSAQDAEKEIVRLMWAIEKDDLPQLEKLIKEWKDPNREFSKGGITLLHYAAMNGSINSLRLLLKVGAKVNLRAESGSSPLDMACSLGFVEVCKELIKSGAEVNGVGKSGKTALFYCKNVEVITVLVESGADVHHTDALGRNSLHSAVLGKKVEVAKELVRLGVSPMALDKEGKSAKDLAKGVFELENAVDKESSRAEENTKFGRDPKAKTLRTDEQKEDPPKDPAP
ncbi:MAG: ankyrin repeat domain-containing protein [Planctomycetes bacterium]|nr:ankyrin repeat domain-containing protein [Planctomycetota bacterium]